jgi:hypothetical protein
MNDFALPVSDCVLFPLALSAAHGDHNLADEALQLLRVQFRYGRYDPTRPFLPWAAVVVRRYCYDAFRLRLRESGGTDRFAELAGKPAEFSVCESAIDLTTPFGPDDRRAVLAWRPKNRLVVLGWSGLWSKLGPGDQRATLDAVKPTEPFPVPAFLDWPEKDRTRYLARALRLRPNTIAKIRERGLPRLRALRFVRELRGT